MYTEWHGSHLELGGIQSRERRSIQDGKRSMEARKTIHGNICKSAMEHNDNDNDDDYYTKQENCVSTGKLNMECVMS